MRPIKTADDIAALTREELWSAPPSALRILQDYPYELTATFNARIRELMPDVVEMCDVAVRAFRKGDLTDAPFVPLRALPPYPIVFAFTRLMKAAEADFGLARHVHKNMVESVMKLFSGEVLK